MQYAFLVISILFLLTILLLHKIFKIRQQKKIEEMTDPMYTIKPLLNYSEKEFYTTLENTVQNKYIILSKVRLWDILDIVRNQDKSTKAVLRNKIQSKHVDFLLCDRKTFLPLIAIELDGESHKNYWRRKRDEFVNKVYKNANLPILHIPASYARDTALLAKYLKMFHIEVLTSIPAK